MAAVVSDGVLSHFDNVGQENRGQLVAECIERLVANANGLNH